MDICKAYRNKTVKIQCSARIKTGFFCGKHQSTPVPIFDMNGNLIMAGSDNGNCGDGDDCRDNIKKIIQNNDKVKNDSMQHTMNILTKTLYETSKYLIIHNPKNKVKN